MSSTVRCRSTSKRERGRSRQNFFCPAERAALALDGGVLCGTSFENTELSREFGYASVIQPVCHEAMACAVSAFAQEFGLSGFFAGDFVIENETGSG